MKAETTSGAARRRAFTLIELLLLVALIAQVALSVRERHDEARRRPTWHYRTR